MGSEYFFAFFLVFVLAAAFAAWLEFRRKQKLADLVKASLEAGQTPPQQLLDALLGNRASTSRQWWRAATPYAVLGLAFALAAGWSEPSPTRDAFLIVAVCMGVAMMAALFAHLVWSNRGRG
jgi:peptidoglycan/LPS O-acetylase OafA/YrhL